MSKVVSQNPDILGGEPVFVGTRVPVKSLFDHLEAGDSIEEFLEGFPSVKREQVIALLEEAREHAPVRFRDRDKSLGDAPSQGDESYSVPGRTYK
jgi:uncharacterized protein (DUF433 family)